MIKYWIIFILQMKQLSDLPKVLQQTSDRVGNLNPNLIQNSCSFHITLHTQCYQTSLTFSTSVGLAIVEDITPDTTPQIILIRRVSSVKRRGGKKERTKCLLVLGTSFWEQSTELSEEGKLSQRNDCRNELQSLWKWTHISRSQISTEMYKNCNT